MVMRSRLSSFQTGKTAPLGFVETASLLGTSLEHSLLLQASERNKETLARCASPVPMITGVEEIGPLERACFYAASGIMGSPLLPPFSKCWKGLHRQSPSVAGLGNIQI
ncbi:hypothetical protein ATANTOWER_018876 [Ataeniobius toweri]|uniref:Uncharacterized protein n=1 Tax=Ataeniobius toweri TaxID=208326 RepID=A0ABU7AYQ8_9TELE|nr:hypothetical protein [Ataeniobius toweri]